MKDDPLIIRRTVLDIKDVELTLRIRRNPAENIVIEIKDGEAAVSFEHAVVKEVPFAKKKRAKK